MNKQQELEWITAPAPVEYEAALSFMEDRVAAIIQGLAPECIWLLEHPPLYTAGTSANARDLITPDRFPVYKTGRGGEFTYHGPGQRIIYVMLDLNRRVKDVRWFVHELEGWVIAACAALGVTAVRREGRVGLWVERPDGLVPSLAEPLDDKIAAIGIRLRKWVSFHGISINVTPDLEHFSGIVPCGISAHGVTSFKALGHATTMAALDEALKGSFDRFFKPGPGQTD